MKIENKEMLLYSMNKAIDNAVTELKNEDTKEVFYAVGTAVHWIVDCIDRVDELYGLEISDKEMRLALHGANNALKHCVDFVALHEQEYGYDFPYDFPIEMKVFYEWKDLSKVKLHHEIQKEMYQKILRGRHIENTLIEIKERVNYLFEEIENKGSEDNVGI